MPKPKTGKNKSKDNAVSAKQIKLQKLAVLLSPHQILTFYRPKRRSKKK